jgi:hypothetical protein
MGRRYARILGRPRCTHPTHPDFSAYGGSGITVHAPWLGEHGFESFLADVGERPAGKTLDRFPDHKGNYEPGNVRWATAAEQIQNRRVNVLDWDRVNEIRGRFEHGERQASIARRMNIDSRTISGVVRNQTWKEIVC